MEAVKWHMIRAAQMLVAMRAVSIGFQLDGGVLPNLPEPLPYFGYLFFVGTILFGPWMPFNDYIYIGKSKQSVLNNVIFSLTISVNFLNLIFSFDLSDIMLYCKCPAILCAVYIFSFDVGLLDTLAYTFRIS